MAKLINNRNMDVIVPLPLGGEALVEAGGVLSTSDEHAKSLLEQPDNWQPAKEKESAKSKVEDKEAE